jgi:transcriptional regulator NrdR family protein
VVDKTYGFSRPIAEFKSVRRRRIAVAAGGAFAGFRAVAAVARAAVVATSAVITPKLLDGLIATNR